MLDYKINQRSILKILPEQSLTMNFFLFIDFERYMFQALKLNFKNI